MADNVTIEVGDKMCRGFTGSDGKTKYHADDHKIEMPRSEAENILKSKDPDVRRYTKSWAVGIDLKAMEAAKHAREAGEQ